MSTCRQFLKIEGEAVSIVTERVERTVRLTDLVAEMSRSQGIVTPLLPQGCRFFSSIGDRSTFVIEQAPTVRSLVWERMDQNGNAKWKLAFPYVIFLVIFRGTVVSTDECRIFYRTSPLSDTSDVLLRTNLCNVYRNGRICTGTLRVQGETLAQKADSFVSGFWGSRFNSDLHDENWRPAASKFPQVVSLAAWQTASEENPLFPLGVEWLQHGPLSAVLQEGR